MSLKNIICIALFCMNVYLNKAHSYSCSYDSNTQKISSLQYSIKQSSNFINSYSILLSNNKYSKEYTIYYNSYNNDILTLSPSVKQTTAPTYPTILKIIKFQSNITFNGIYTTYFDDITKLLLLKSVAYGFNISKNFISWDNSFINIPLTQALKLQDFQVKIAFNIDIPLTGIYSLFSADPKLLYQLLLNTILNSVTTNTLIDYLKKLISQVNVPMPSIQNIGIVKVQNSQMLVVNITTPTIASTYMPINVPTIDPTTEPTNSPTNSPTFMPTINPSIIPSIKPTNIPTNFPTNSPSSGIPSCPPTIKPTLYPTLSPTNYSSYAPSFAPTIIPSNYPSLLPSYNKTYSPSKFPTYNRTYSPSEFPTMYPTINATKIIISKIPSYRPNILRNSTHTISSNNNNNGNRELMIASIILGIFFFLTFIAICVSGYRFYEFVGINKKKIKNFFGKRNKTHSDEDIEVNFSINPSDQTKKNSVLPIHEAL